MTDPREIVIKFLTACAITMAILAIIVQFI